MLVYDDNDSIDLMINPKILDMAGKQMHVEGCFSVPGIWGYAVSPYQVKMQYLDGNLSDSS